MYDFSQKVSDVSDKSEATFDESGEKQTIHSEKDSSNSGTPIQEEESQLTFR